MYTKKSAQQLLVTVVGVLVWIITLQNLVFVVNGDEALVERLCRGTDDYDTCIKCENSYSLSKTANDSGVIEYAMDCGLKSLSKLQYDTTDLDLNSTDVSLKGALEKCHDQFLAALTMYKGVVNKVLSRDFKGAKIDVAGQDSMLVKITSCYQIFESSGNKMPEIMFNDLNNVVRDWGRIVAKMLDQVL